MKGPHFWEGVASPRFAAAHAALRKKVGMEMTKINDVNVIGLKYRYFKRERLFSIFCDLGICR